jgi:hypothetical protein
MIPANRERTLSREISVTQIPSGDKHTLPSGTKIQIHQTLGGSYTVQTDFGLFRIDGKDGDALGEVGRRPRSRRRPSRTARPTRRPSGTSCARCTTPRSR